MDQPELGGGLDAALTVTRDAFELDVAITAQRGQVLTVLGPNGAGKTTLLRALAGLLPLSAGRVVLDGVTLEDTEGGVSTPPEARPVGVVFQDYLLFPRMTALDNVAFGLRARGWQRDAARQQGHQWLARVGLAEFASRRPGALSGGQAQRVALARALAFQPPLLLLDEPLAALDAATRMEVRSDLRRHLAEYGGVTVLITHDPLEALVLGHELIVLDHGRIVQSGSPKHVAEHPRTDYVARLLGLNLFRGQADRHGVRINDAVAFEVVAEHRGSVFAVIRPAHVVVHRKHPEGSSRNVWPGVVDRLELHGDWVRVHVDGVLPTAADVTPAAIAELALAPGDEVWLSCKATEITVYPQ